MSIATDTAREVTTSTIATGRRRERSPRSMVFLGLLWFSLFFGVIVLVVLIVDTVIEGSGRFDKGAWSSSGRTISLPVAQVLRMKIKNSLRALRKRHRNNRVVRRRGRLYVINKTNRRFKARQG